MDAQQLSLENNRILRDLQRLIEGAGEDSPGLAHTVRQHDELLIGKDGHPGILGKVHIMWRVHVWLMCTFSAAAGSALTLLIKRFL